MSWCRSSTRRFRRRHDLQPLRGRRQRSDPWSLITGPASRPAAEVVTELVGSLRAQLEATGDWDIVSELARQVLIAGTSSARQRRALRRRGRLTDVVDQLIAETAGRWPTPQPPSATTQPCCSATSRAPMPITGSTSATTRPSTPRGPPPRLSQRPADRRPAWRRGAAVPGGRHRAGAAGRQHHVPCHQPEPCPAVSPGPGAADGCRPRSGPPCATGWVSAPRRWTRSCATFTPRRRSSTTGSSACRRSTGRPASGPRGGSAATPCAPTLAAPTWCVTGGPLAGARGQPAGAVGVGVRDR